MANYLKLPIARCLLLLLCSYLAAIVSSHTTRSEQAHSFPNERLYRAYLVIQRFKSTITSDPKNVTATWTGNDICDEKSYLGIYCATPTGRSDDLRVTGIIWNGYGFRAPKLQGFLDQLPDLAFFHAASNYFGSDIPRLDAVPYFYNLNVDKNPPVHPQDEAYVSGDSHIRGPCINGDIHFMIKVGTDLPKKKWDWGKIPAGATNAKAVLLNYNSLSGPLPANLGASKLSYLALANNKLTGPIPPSIAQAQDSLLEMLLLNNQLSGCLPHELGMLINATVIDAGMNQLTGPIPSSFSCLTSVEQLNLGGNRIYGEIPDALCKLAAGPAGRLANLTLSSNYFTSVGPACLSLIKDGVLNVKNNCIPGFANQRRPAECASFLSQPKACPAATATHVACPAAAANAAAAPADRVAKDYSSYVTYATLHE
uniref:Leucine-rich repeat-containing N-terminal plant-type domain-containing protein n=1 Tax=Oryza rufipogon TaxID=4529 RepID=A0A0E0Q720_ORYRU